MRRQKAIQQHGKISGEEDFNYFMTILYSSDQLNILGYHRVLKSLNNLSKDNFIKALESTMSIRELSKNDQLKPKAKNHLSLIFKDSRFECKFKTVVINNNDPVKGLDVQILSDNVLEKILGIKDLKNDERIDFVGGVEGIDKVVKRCNEDCLAGFIMNPVDINDLFKVADAGLIMPPKSTWFEPKPRSGFVVRKFFD